MNKKKSVKMILVSLFLIVAGFILFMIAIEKTKTGWYKANISIRPGRREALDYGLAICLILLGCFNIYRGIKGKSFQWQIDRMFSSHEDGSPYACPHCGAKLEKGQFSCLICGKRII